jgi:ABC-type histidine transport system ATPase subunit
MFPHLYPMESLICCSTFEHFQKMEQTIQKIELMLKELEHYHLMIQPKNQIGRILSMLTMLFSLFDFGKGAS